MNAIIPIPRCEVRIRPATMEDLAFIDALQRRHDKMVGWMPSQQLEGKIRLGHVIIAEDEAAQPLGYCIGADRYFKRDDLGIIYQMNVVPERQRSLIGATLVRAMFDRAAYGCKLFCCWCAQDIAANYFWESLGFVPLAFRAGSRDKGRVHIFWERRIRPGDTTTPYWFPSQTSSGSIREDRLVLPIPPGTHWRDAKPLILPGPAAPALPEPRQRERAAKEKPPVKQTVTAMGGLRLGAPNPAALPTPKPARQKRPTFKNDPRHVAAARELRDRWLEHVNSGEFVLTDGAKYDVTRALQAPRAAEAIPLLPAAA